MDSANPVILPGGTAKAGAVEGITHNTKALATADREYPVHLCDFAAVAVALKFGGEAGGYGYLTGLRPLTHDAYSPSTTIHGNITGSNANTLGAAERTIVKEFYQETIPFAMPLLLAGHRYQQPYIPGRNMRHIVGGAIR